MERNVAAQNKGRLSNTQKQLKSLQWEHEVGSFESLLSLKVLHPATALRNFCCGFLLSCFDDTLGMRTSLVYLLPFRCVDVDLDVDLEV